LFDFHHKTAYNIVKSWSSVILRKPLHPHALRHSKAIALRKKGVPLEDIADLLGHKSIDTTRIYARVTGTHLKKLPQTI